MKPVALKTADDCRFLGGISRQTLWRRAKRAGVEKNIFGTYNIEELTKIRRGER